MLNKLTQIVNLKDGTAITCAKLLDKRWAIVTRDACFLDRHSKKGTRVAYFIDLLERHTGSHGSLEISRKDYETHAAKGHDKPD